MLLRSIFNKRRGLRPLLSSKISSQNIQDDCFLFITDEKTKQNGQLKKSKNCKLNQTFNENNHLTIQFLTFLKRFSTKT